MYGKCVEVGTLGSVATFVCFFCCIDGKGYFHVQKSYRNLLAYPNTVAPSHLPQYFFASGVRRHRHLKLWEVVGSFTSQPILIIPACPDGC
jgi:hypothetical protein